MRMIEYLVNGRGCHLHGPARSGAVPAQELAREYHRRWECELTYDELKTHLATVTHGTLHTVFRSDRRRRQEMYATFITYNILRRLIVEAGEAHGGLLEISS
jgi:hypothetical protein